MLVILIVVSLVLCLTVPAFLLPKLFDAIHAGRRQTAGKPIRKQPRRQPYRRRNPRPFEETEKSWTPGRLL